MRQIKFRGKRKNTGEWAYGDLVRNVEGAFAVVPPYQMDMNNVCSNYEVRPESIGQFTGFLDKKGNEIYEGDMLGWWNYDASFIPETVLFYDGCFMIKDDYSFDSISTIDTSLRIVIGNIHDKPGLLK